MADAWINKIGMRYDSKRNANVEREMIVSFQPVLSYLPKRGIPAVISPIITQVVENRLMPWFQTRINEFPRELNFQIVDMHYRRNRVYLHFDVRRSVEEDVQTLLTLLEDVDLDGNHLVRIQGKPLHVGVRDIQVIGGFE